MSGLFGRKPSVSTTPTIYNAIQLTRSSYGQPVPLCYGQMKLPAFLMYYDDFVGTPHSVGGGGKGGGGSNSQTYTYTATIMLGLCEGPIVSVPTIYDGAAQHTNMADLGFSNLALGSIGQAIWSFLSSNHPTKAIPYSSVAHIDAAPYQLGSSAGLPNLQFEIAGLKQYGGGVIDAEPSAMISDYMTDPGHGANFPYMGVLTGANSFQQWCVSMGMFVSYMEDTQRAAVDFLKEVLQLTNSAGVIRGDGKLYLVPYADQAVSGNGGSFTPNMTPLFAFTDDDYCPQKSEDPVELMRKPYSQTFNWVNVEYTDRSNKYNIAVASAYDDADFNLNGARVMPAVSLHAITNPTLAKLVAQLILQRNLYYRNQYQWRARHDYSSLEPMDLVSMTDSNLGLNNILVRILDCEEDNKTGILTFKGEEVPVGPATAPQYSWQAAQGYSTNMANAPGHVNAPYIFLVPSGLSTDGQARIGIAVNGPNNGLWAGCNVWISFDGTNYESFGPIMNPSRYGTLSALLANGSDPDTTNSIGVTLNRTDLTLTGGTQADADQMRTLLIVDGELISYQSATFVSAGNYTLGTYLRRGCYGSVIGSHALGANWARLDQSIVTLPLDVGMLGQTIHFKFTSFNIYMQGTESLASVTDYTYTPSAGQTGGTGEAWNCVGNAVAQAGRLYKPLGFSTVWDSNASGKALSGACWMQCRIMDTGQSVFGLTTAPATASYTGSTFAINPNSNGAAVAIYEYGTLVTNPAIAWAKGDSWAVRYDGKGTYYYHNGTLIWTSRRPLPATTPLYPVAYFENFGGGLYDAVYGSGETSQGHQSGANLLANLAWIPGTSGSQGLFFDTNGGTAGQIVLGDGSSATLPFGPYGTSDVLWQARGSAAANNWGGFYNPSNTSQPAPYLAGDIVGLDPTKSYRYVCWFMFHGPTTGGAYIYHGCDAGGITLDITTGNPADANPYFVFCPCASLTADKWYMAVGFLHGSGNTNTAQSGATGIYDPVTGQRVAAANGYSAGSNVPFGSDFQQKPGACGQSIRSFFYGQTTGGSTAFYGWFAKPRFEEMNGNEPSIPTLLSPNGALAYLNQVDSPQIVANAATAVVTATNSSGIALANGSGLYASAASVSVGPFPFATTVVVTCTCELDATNSTGSVQTQGATTAIHDSVSGNLFCVNTNQVQVPPTSSMQVPVAAEYTFSLPASTSATYQWGGYKQIIYLSTQMANNVIKAEVIKR